MNDLLYFFQFVTILNLFEKNLNNENLYTLLTFLIKEKSKFDNNINRTQERPSQNQTVLFDNFINFSNPKMPDFDKFQIEEN